MKNKQLVMDNRYFILILILVGIITMMGSLFFSLIVGFFLVKVGVDIENIDRFKIHVRMENNSFLSKIFTVKELEYCYSKSNPAVHLAARYSGKEAVIKALTSIDALIPEYNHIEILNNGRGVPVVSINEEGFDNYKFNISLSHCDDKVVGFAVVEK